MADGRQGFQAHGAALGGPLVVPLQEQGADESDDHRLVRRDTDDIAAALDLVISPLSRSSGLVEWILARCAAGKPIDARRPTASMRR